MGWFGVRPEYRHQGIGSILLEFTIEEAIKRGFNCLKIYTSSDKSAKPARRLYESHEFKKLNSCSGTESVYYIRDLAADASKIGV